MKNTIKPAGSVSAVAATKAAKKIDLGAASNYGKSVDFGINSPTHRNTHNEDLFVSEPEVVKTRPAKTSNAIIEDIFASAEGGDDDDFDPRAEEKSQDFGDFESAFTGQQVASVNPVAFQQPAQSTSSEFADFSAFNAPTASMAAQAATASSQSDIDNFLFSSPPPPQPSSVAPPKSFLDGTDLFGNNVITSAFTSPPTSLTTGSGKDLLSDFDNLTLNPIKGEKKVFDTNFIILNNRQFACSMISLS